MVREDTKICEKDVFPVVKTTWKEQQLEVFFDLKFEEGGVVWLEMAAATLQVIVLSTAPIHFLM